MRAELVIADGFISRRGAENAEETLIFTFALSASPRETVLGSARTATSENEKETKAAFAELRLQKKFTSDYTQNIMKICLSYGPRTWPGLLVAMLLAVTGAPAAPTDDVYLLGPDSMPHEGVPKGKVVGPLTLASEVFTNTTRHYWIYVPAQYDPKTPADLMIFQDGQAFVGPGGEYRIPCVFDNLIYRREMPVTIGVFINPGHRPDQLESSPTNWGDSINNRGIEYNELNDHYAKLIVDELMPALEKDYNISKNPDDRGIGGASSGAICAFTVAWQRPDQFHKVISTIGSFTDIHGGDVYPDLIRQSERKPIRIYLQDGLNDLRGRGRNGGDYNPKRDWHAQNLKMVAALTEKGYDVNYCWGIGTHSGKQGGAIMPEMLRWLWRDCPRPDDPMDDSNRKLLVPVEK